MTAVAIAGAALMGVVILFQIALFAGAPWGSVAWGGRHPGVLPARLRVASAFSAVLLAFLAWVILAAAGVVTSAPLPEDWLTPAAWAMTGYFALGVLANLASRSKPERWWAVVALATAVCCGLVAAG